jgi:uncharacterized protein YndB with AHSA1/START domain
MTDELSTQVSLKINAPTDRVWKALTTPDLIKKWFFGVDTKTDWAEGSPIVHRGEYQGKPYEDKGTILKVDPGRRIVHTHWSPSSGLPDIPENYEEVTWELSEREGRTELVVSEVNLPSEKAKSISEQSWSAALTNLKELLEDERSGGT